ncbi:MAG: SDR family NAD(P)-dependent oxidoreductase [Rubricoccaceae bacterium]|nr:SDR family NAD(P)-dependent oxidoreductase [Rubricoccaceae bacterium]
MTVLITGASAGIGAAAARRFAAEGARVLLAARSEDRLRTLAAEIDVAHGDGTAHVLPLDVTDAVAHEAALASLPDDWRALDVAVLNAGLALNLVPVWENRVDEIDTMVDVNVKGILYGLRAIVPGMLARGQVHLVLIGSTAGHTVYPGGTVYCATKHAVLALADGLKMDLHGTPLRVSVVSPGLTETEFSLVRFEGDAARADAVYRDTRPLSAEDVADAILYCVQAPPHVNVQELLMQPRVQSGSRMVARGEAAEGL